jgi:hypothetical protein
VRDFRLGIKIICASMCLLITFSFPLR